MSLKNAGYMKHVATTSVPELSINIDLTMNEGYVHFLIDALKVELTRCEKYAKLCMTGYGRSNSHEKRDTWLNRAETCKEALAILYEKIPV